MFYRVILCRMILITHLLGIIGRNSITTVGAIGQYVIFFFTIIIKCVNKKIYVRELIDSIINIGYCALPIISVTSLFTGAVLALQSYAGFSRFNAENSIAAVVAISITRELGPVICGLMIAGRSGAAISAEIGSMKISEQIDALRTLSVDPYKYLYVPRLLAGIISLPLLTIIANIIGIYGGYIVSVNHLKFNSGTYLKKSYEFLNAGDISLGLTKATIFGVIITVSGCYFGNNCDNGSKGVGHAVTSSLVCSCTMILIFNYIITAIFFYE